MKKSELRQVIKEVISEFKTINLEPNWEQLYKYFRTIERTDKTAWKKVKKSMGGEWDKLVKMAEKGGWDD
jgi:6-pyruvoyl-tetrahydropterin synthase